MRIKTGGGGIDAAGNWYKLPDMDAIVPDDYFAKLMTAMKAAPAPEFILVSSDFYAAFEKVKP